MQGIPTEALALSADIFQDFDVNVQAVKDSSIKRNQALDQASRLELANWRISVAQVSPIPNPEGLIEWVEESFGVDKTQFEEPPAGASLQPNAQQQQNVMQQGQLPQQGGQPGGQANPQMGGKPGQPPIQQMQPSNLNQGIGALLGQSK